MLRKLFTRPEDVYVPQIVERPVVSSLPPAPPAPVRSIIGHAVSRFNSARVSYTAREAQLQEEIARLSEELRQTQAAKRAVEAALIAVCQDPALTDDEAEATNAAVDAQMVGAIENVVQEILETGKAVETTN